MDNFIENQLKEESNDKALQEQEDIKSDNNLNPPQYDEDKLQLSKNQNIAVRRSPKHNKDNQEEAQPSDNPKYSMSSDIHNAKYPSIEYNKGTNDTTNKKLRNTMTGLNNDKMKYESGLINIILKVEKDNVNHYLKGDLAEMYNDISKNNSFFKNEVFLANVDNFEKKTGILDKKPVIPYNCSEDISFKLNTYPKTNEIIEKFAQKSKTFQGYA